MLRVDQVKLCHVWPRTMTFAVNNKEVFVVKPPEEGHKRRDIPQEVSSHFAAGLNLVSVRLSDPQPETLYFALVLTAARDVAELAAMVERVSLPKAQARVQDLFAKLQGQGGAKEEDIVCLTTNKLKLLCPITMEKVEEPVRGEQCQHLQCFCLDAYLTSNLKMSAFNNRWMCPVCSLIIRPSDLRVDAYVRSILQSTPEDTEEVVILPNGKWQLCDESLTQHEDPVAQKVAPPSKQETVDLAEAVDSDDEVLSLLTQPGRVESQVSSHSEMVSEDSPASKTSNAKRVQPVASPARPPGGRNKRKCLERASEAEANPPKAFRRQDGRSKRAHSPAVASPSSPKSATSASDITEKFSFSATPSSAMEVVCLD